MLRFFAAALVAGPALCGSPAFARDNAKQVRKPARVNAPATASPSPAGNINAPSTDFSKVERPDDDPDGRSRGGLRPVMGSGGNIGLGGGF